MSPSHTPAAELGLRLAPALAPSWPEPSVSPCWPSVQNSWDAGHGQPAAALWDLGKALLPTPFCASEELVQMSRFPRMPQLRCPRYSIKRGDFCLWATRSQGLAQPSPKFLRDLRQVTVPLRVTLSLLRASENRGKAVGHRCFAKFRLRDKVAVITVSHLGLCSQLEMVGSL